VLPAHGTAFTGTNVIGPAVVMVTLALLGAGALYRARRRSLAREEG